MRTMRAARWGSLLVVLNAANCGSDGGSSGASLQCGPGTVQSDKECVPQCGSGTLLVGAQCMAAESGDAGAPEMGHAGSSSAHAGGSSVPNGDSGAASDDGGSAGESSAGGTGVNGGASSGGAGRGGGATGGAAGVSGGAGGAASTGTPRWLAFSHSDGVFLYDSLQFPDASGLVKLSSHASGAGFAVGPFSPDGRLIAYVDGGDLYLRDVSGAVPGPPLLLVDEVSALDVSAASGRHGYWSRDSKSLAFVSKGSVYVLPVDHAVPSVQRRFASSTSPVLAWSPTDSRLAIGGVGTVELLDTAAGVIIKDTVVNNDGFSAWSPDGSSFVGVVGSNVILTDVTAGTPTVHTLTAPTATTPSVGTVAYGANGATLAFLGVQERNLAALSSGAAPPDLYVVSLKPMLGATVRISAALDALTGVTNFAFSPSGDQLAYVAQTVAENYALAAQQAAYHWTVLRLDGGQPGASTVLTSIPLSGFPSASPISSAWWQPDAKKLLTSALGGITVYDPTGVNPSVKLNAFFGTDLAFENVTSIVAASNFGNLLVTDVGAPQATPSQIAGVGAFDAFSAPWIWSPDGRFIATGVRSGQSQVSLTRVDGVNVSTPVALYPTSAGFTAFQLWWQPELAN